MATGASVTGALVSDNLIGTDAGGLNFLRNPDGVIFTSGVTNSTIGGITVLAQNVISSNGTGVILSGAATTGNLVAGNYLGPNITGAVTLGNTTGVEVTAPGNTNRRSIVQLPQPDRGEHRLRACLLDSSIADPAGSVVDGNYIGVNPIGSATQGNAIGIGINGSDHVTIGGTGSAGNLISGNTITGVQIFGAGASNNVIQGNLIGTDATGALSVPNTQFGIEISNGTGNVVGGSGSTFRNVISGNSQVGLQIDGGSADQVLNNFIGTDSTGETALGNSLAGVVIRTSGNTIGANLISANSGSGIAIGASGISGNVITGNTIGLDSTGENALGNAAAGINITAGTSTTIGGSTAALRKRDLRQRPGGNLDLRRRHQPEHGDSGQLRRPGSRRLGRLWQRHQERRWSGDQRHAQYHHRRPQRGSRQRDLRPGRLRRADQRGRGYRRGGPGQRYRNELQRHGCRGQ